MLSIIPKSAIEILFFYTNPKLNYCELGKVKIPDL